MAPGRTTAGSAAGLPRAQRHYAAIGGAAAARRPGRRRDARRALLYEAGPRDGLHADPDAEGGPVQDVVPGPSSAFGLHGMSVLMRFMHSIFGCPELSFDSNGRALHHELYAKASNLP